MKVLMVGAAGHVGSILRPALEARHELTFFDRQPVDGGQPTVVGDVNDQQAVERAVAGQDAIVYLAMGVLPNAKGAEAVMDIGAGFDVNAQGLYRFLAAGLEAGVRRFVYASTLSVYNIRRQVITENTPPNSWDPYGLTKRVGEFVCHAAAERQPDATVVMLRLYLPLNDTAWAGLSDAERSAGPPIGPTDMRDAFLKALDCDKPGAHAVQVTGDVQGTQFPSNRAQELLGWRPLGK